jgi:hypothetical protein
VRFRSLWLATSKKTLGTTKFACAIGLILSLQPAFARTSLTDTPQSVVVKYTATSPKAKLTLRVYNYAGLDSASLASSEKVADTILKDVGIETAWVDCPVSGRNSRAYPACESPMGTTDLVLRILPRRMAVKLRHSYDSLGFAQTCPFTEPACELTVFYHRVDELAARGYRADRILGHAIVHEIAHVLLGPAHSEEGIMRAAWTPSDLQHISLGLQLDFTNDQSTQLRRAVLCRTTPPAPQGLEQANLIAR